MLGIAHLVTRSKHMERPRPILARGMCRFAKGTMVAGTTRFGQPTLRMEYFVSSYMIARLSGCSLLRCLEAMEWTRDRSRSTSGSFFRSARDASASGESLSTSSETASKRPLICLPRLRHKKHVVTMTLPGSLLHPFGWHIEGQTVMRFTMSRGTLREPREAR